MKPMTNDILKAKLKKEKRQNRLIIALALLTTFAFHGLLYAMFLPPEKPVNTKPKDLKRIVYLDINNPANRRWLNFYDFANPTYLVKPNQRLGYSSLFHRQNPLNPKDIITNDISSLTSFFTPEKPRYSSQPQQASQPDDVDLFSFTPQYMPQPAVSDASKITPQLTYPYCFDNAGRSYRLFSRTDISKNTKTTNNISLSEFKVSYNGKGFFPSVKLLKSSGAPKLDILAYKSILQNHRILDLNDHSKEKEISIQWIE